MLIAWLLNALALAGGAALGFRALIDPNWAARFVRLKADEQGGGFAEFRATYGGVFAGAHVVALLLTLIWLSNNEYVVGVAATGASAVLATAWGGAAFGRALSMWRDNTKTRFNVTSACVEAGFAIGIGAPWVVWLLFPPR